MEYILEYALDVLDYLRQLNAVSIVVRLLVAMICGGLIGMLTVSKKKIHALGNRHVIILAHIQLHQYNIYDKKKYGNNAADPKDYI